MTLPRTSESWERHTAVVHSLSQTVCIKIILIHTSSCENNKKKIKVVKRSCCWYKCSPSENHLLFHLITWEYIQRKNLHSLKTWIHSKCLFHNLQLRTVMILLSSLPSLRKSKSPSCRVSKASLDIRLPKFFAISTERWENLDRASFTWYK